MHAIRIHAIRMQYIVLYCGLSGNYYTRLICMYDIQNNYKRPKNYSQNAVQYEISGHCKLASLRAVAAFATNVNPPS